MRSQLNELITEKKKVLARVAPEDKQGEFCLVGMISSHNAEDMLILGTALLAGRNQKLDSVSISSPARVEAGRALLRKPTARDVKRALTVMKKSAEDLRERAKELSPTGITARSWLNDALNYDRIALALQFYLNRHGKAAE